jgi:hypothetical protein
MLDLLIFIHPINPLGQPHIYNYRFDLIVGLPMDTTIAAVRLVYSGVLGAVPTLAGLSRASGRRATVPA